MDVINKLEREISELKETLSRKENELRELFKTNTSTVNITPGSNEECKNTVSGNYGCRFTKLPRWAIERYSRQILLPQIGVPGQDRICGGRVLVVGAGGLGCPAAAYLAGSGVGCIGIVDYDSVDLTNIHRQLLHAEGNQNMSKVESAADALRRINSRITIKTYNVQLDSGNAMEIISEYDIVLDCTDNVPTRYLLNDACVLNKVPLISGSALKMEGQLTVYNYITNQITNEQSPFSPGPCHRCLFPAPPPPAAVGSCSADGVCGPVPGTIGSLQALEAIKYLVGSSNDNLLVSRMLIFDGEDMTFRVVKLRGKNPNCAICSESPTITKLVDYELFCRTKAVEKDLDLKILSPDQRISAKELHEELQTQRHLVVDVRSANEFQMCRIDGASNYPIDNLERDFEKLVEEVRSCGRVTFLCRRGNDSQIAARKILQEISDCENIVVKDLTGGLHAWAKQVDKDFPIY